MVFAGPSADSITEMGLKHRARQLAVSIDVPVVSGTDLLSTAEEAVEAANKLAFPVMLKATGGGGGMGLQICQSADEVRTTFASVQSRGETLFKNAGVFLEKYYPKSRHVEVQVFGNGSEVVHFGERECSIQRRHQKVCRRCRFDWSKLINPGRRRMPVTFRRSKTGLARENDDMRRQIRLFAQLQVRGDCRVPSG
jgi:urea carboxylase